MVTTEQLIDKVAELDRRVGTLEGLAVANTCRREPSHIAATTAAEVKRKGLSNRESSRGVTKHTLYPIIVCLLHLLAVISYAYATTAMW